MGYIRSTVIIVALLTFTFLLPSFAQEGTQEEYIIKTVYFLPKNRDIRENIDTKINTMVESFRLNNDIWFDLPDF